MGFVAVAEVFEKGRCPIAGPGQNRDCRIGFRTILVGKIGPKLLQFIRTDLGGGNAAIDFAYVPQQYGCVGASRSQKLSVRREADASDGSGVAFEFGQFFAREYVPDTDGLVTFSGRGERHAIGRERKKRYLPLVRLQLPN